MSVVERVKGHLDCAADALEAAELPDGGEVLHACEHVFAGSPPQVCIQHPLVGCLCHACQVNHIVKVHELDRCDGCGGRFDELVVPDSAVVEGHRFGVRHPRLGFGILDVPVDAGGVQLCDACEAEWRASRASLA